MIDYLDRLKSLNEKNLPLEGTAQTAKIDLHGLCSSQEAQKNSISVDGPAIAAVPAWRWILHFAERDPLEVAVCPPASHAEVLRQYPAALAAEPCDEIDRTPTNPIPDDDETIEEVQRCTDCRHARRPGGAVRYCASGRDDLPPAYGAGHPLRRLPADGGAGCEQWGLTIRGT